MTLSNHPRLADEQFQADYNLSPDAPFNTYVAYVVVIGDAPQDHDILHPASPLAVSEAGVGSAGQDVTGWEGTMLLTRREGRLIMSRVALDADDPDFATLVDVETLPDDIEVPTAVNVFAYNSDASSLPYYSAFSPLAASIVGVGGGALVYTETSTPTDPAPQYESDFRRDNFTLTYYGAQVDELAADPSALTTGAKTRRVTFSAT